MASFTKRGSRAANLKITGPHKKEWLHSPKEEAGPTNKNESSGAISTQEEASMVAQSKNTFRAASKQKMCFTKSESRDDQLKKSRAA
jgi:hypothetical protein